VDSPEVQELPQSPQCEVTPCPPTPPYQPSFDLSIEEADTFQQENVQLLEQFHDVTDEVRLIQEKVLQISELQSLFTEKVMEQAKNIELVADNAVTSTENVSAGNEEVRGVSFSNITRSLMDYLYCSYTCMYIHTCVSSCCCVCLCWEIKNVLVSLCL
jgi:hypothetical protein